MMFDVMVREGYKPSDRPNGSVQVINVYRIHDSGLSRYLRDMQTTGKYIIAVIPLFKKKEQPVVREQYMSDAMNDFDKIPDIGETRFRKGIDPRLLKDSIGE
jgi:hypothetical protein